MRTAATLLAFVALIIAILSLPSTIARPGTQQGAYRVVQLDRLERRTVNTTVLAACKALQPSNKVHYLLAPQFTATLFRYIGSTNQKPVCLFMPTEPSEIAAALKVIADQKVPFAVSSGRHASNNGFSTTSGIQIDMKGFQQVKLASDKSYVDVGTGNVWDNVYQVLESEHTSLAPDFVSTRS